MYCTPQNVRDLHQLLSEADFADDYIQKYITKAEARINDKLRPQYVVPLVDPIPSVIKTICEDMAAGMMCQHHFSLVNYREDTPLAEIFRKRAEDDLEYVLEHSTLNDLPGIVEQPPKVPESRRRVATTTPNPSPLSGRLQQFDRATRSPLNGGVWP